MTMIAFSGHRPDKIGGYSLPNPTYTKICQETENILLQLKPDKCISGLALGYDQYAMSVCLKLGIPVLAAVPFLGQEKAWPEASQKSYRRLLAKAAEVVIVSEGGYAPWKMQTRNEWMVNNCDLLLCCWDGSRGGTGNCVVYAEKIGKPIRRIIP